MEYGMAFQSQPRGAVMTPQQLAALFHYNYEKLAPQFGYETREETREFDENSPNGRLMIAVCSLILDWLVITWGDDHEKLPHVILYALPEVERQRVLSVIQAANWAHKARYGREIASFQGYNSNKMSMSDTITIDRVIRLMGELQEERS
jgi:hypothetical protein